MDENVSKAVLISGCSTGIGRATAERLHERGWNVYATARNPDSIADLAGRGMKTLALDVTNESSIREAVAAVEAAEGAVGVLVNNAGYGQQGAVEAVELDAIRRQFETNLLGYVRLAQACLPGMRHQRWGRIVNLSSVNGRVVFPAAGVYCATKHAIEALSDALRFEVRGFGIEVAIVEPGPIRTEFTGAAGNMFPAPGTAGGVYDELHAAVEKGDAETDQSFIAGDADDVAKAIERAIGSRRPRARYRVTAVARLLPKLRALIRDRGWDLFLRTQAPRPSAKR
ncbi:MAG: hypothetical protein QOG26_978 [Solirubrobacterales bacterium]|nr:hypothetical protein [Solirubrobacterales bacterium]